ncbi:c-type cytochrome biogenesis protein CcmI [Rhodocyclaceae bacterium SMB388]
MTGFSILAAILVAGALLLVIPPMLGFGRRRRAHAARQRQADTALVVLREQLAELEADLAAGKLTEAEHARSRDELELRALNEGRAAVDGSDARPASLWAVGLMVVIPALAVLTYLNIGEPDALDPDKVAGTDQGHQITPDQMVGLVAQLADRLERDPSDPMGWVMLVRSYAMLGDLEGAATTWRRIGDKAPDDADVLADWADILVGAQDGNFAGEPDRLIARALELQPDNFKALALSGTASFQRADYVEAERKWTLILDQIPPESDTYRSVLSSVNEARSRAGLPRLDPVATASLAAPAATEPASSGLAVTGTVSLSPALAADVKPDEVVFVFVRPVGGGIPVAALRFRAGELPLSFDFDGVRLMSEAPLPEQVIVAARLSRGGDATARPGDLEGASAPVATDGAGVEVVIDRVRE